MLINFHKMIVHKRIIFSILLILFFPSLNGQGEKEIESIKVTIKQGKLVGSTLKSRNGRDFSAFQGIPYARPPIKELRFRDPVPAEKWKEEFKATSEPERCPQKQVNRHKMTDVYIGKEDCLYLNVYTPKTTDKIENLMPVMFWIPGVLFSSGHGGLSSNGPHYLLDKDVVVVSINYRVGILGFLSTEDDNFPGNYGLKDQVLALKWVKNNIEEFGGDPNKVTIFGEGAGGASVGLHLLSPMSKGLFHKAIMESGSPLSEWAVRESGRAKHIASDVIEKLECDENQTQAECLRNVSAEKLVDLQDTSFKPLSPIVNFPPVVENCKNSSQSFLCNYPFENFVQVSNVPVLLGISSSEGEIFANNMWNIDGNIIPGFEKSFNSCVMSSLMRNPRPGCHKIDSICKKARFKYFLKGNLNDYSSMTRMIRDSFYVRGINDMALKMSFKRYYYVYDHVNEYSLSVRFTSYPNYIPEMYKNELISLFYIDCVPELKGNDLEMSKLMVNMWTQFATTDELTINGKADGVPWPEFDTKSMKYVFIRPTKNIISMKPYMSGYIFWNSLKECP